MLVMTAPAVIPAWATGVLHSTPATSVPEFTFAMLAGTEDSSLLRQPLPVPPLPPRPPAELPPADWLLCSSCCSWVCGLLEVLGPLLELATVTPRKGGSPIWIVLLPLPAAIVWAMDSARLIGIAKPWLAPGLDGLVELFAAVFIPMTLPAVVASAPPESPDTIGASVCSMSVRFS